MNRTKTHNIAHQNFLHFLSLYYSAQSIEHTFKCLWLQGPLSLSPSLCLGRMSWWRRALRGLWRGAMLQSLKWCSRARGAGADVWLVWEGEEEEEGEVKTLRQTRKPLWEAQLEHKQKTHWHTEPDLKGSEGRWAGFYRCYLMQCQMCSQ